MWKNLALFLIFFCPSKYYAQEIKFTDGHDSWNPDSLGNHRAVVYFGGKGSIARVVIPWRRNDDHVQSKQILVVDAKTGTLVLNTKTGILKNESGEVYFEPKSGKGMYYVYYMPYRNTGRNNYPNVAYLTPKNTASDQWLTSVHPEMAVNAEVREIQSVNEFNSMYPMEVIATPKETTQLLAKNKGKAFLVFPEDRMHPIRMTDRLPYRWIESGIKTSFLTQADKGESVAFQLGVYALKDLDNLTVSFSDLKDAEASYIEANNISCINTTGTDYKGQQLNKTIKVQKDHVQALWCIIEVPVNAKPGIYKGKATISAQGTASLSIMINLQVSDHIAENRGLDEPWKQTRLKWLNSTLAQENTVIAPYIPLKVEGNEVSLLGRKLLLDQDGLPNQVQTFFTREMTDYQLSPNNLLIRPMRFLVTSEDGKEIRWINKGLQFTKKEAGTVTWKALNTANQLNMEVNGSLEFDGFMSFRVKITALEDTDIKDIALEIPFLKEKSKYMMGLGQKGGYMPAHFEWKWDVAAKNQDGAWIGDVNAGLQFSLRDEKYIRPLNTNFYLQKPLLLPASWGNGNKGGIAISENSDAVNVVNYSGERLMKKGDSLFYNFTMLMTPFHPINTDFQWRTRFYHKYDNLDTIKATTATVINIHHATPINPWINYPFIEYKKMKEYIDEAHSKGLKVKIYNTIRELSDRAYETFPLRSLGHEIYSTGPGGGYSWLQEHLKEDYIAAWFVPEIKDAAIVNSGMNRWHNYYVEGMNWLVRNVNIDGIYLDDVAFDRVTMKRIKRVLTQDGHPGIIDLHSANQFNKNDGFNNSANLYMEHFPYLNRLWFGEYFDYQNNGPDFFLTEVSGIPFGLMGEMLEGGGNPWRGMIFGMTNRFPWTREADPRPLWKFWDEFGMQGTEMIGYWSDKCPVKTSNEKVKATVYRKNGTALISIASWAENDLNIILDIDWKSLGINPQSATLTAKPIPGFQVAKTFELNEPIPVAKAKGWLLIVK